MNPEQAGADLERLQAEVAEAVYYGSALVEQLNEGRRRIEHWDQKATDYSDDAGMATAYLLPAGAHNQLLSWARTHELTDVLLKFKAFLARHPQGESR